MSDLSVMLHGLRLRGESHAADLIERLTAEIEGHGGWDEWIAEHVRVSEELERLTTPPTDDEREALVKCPTCNDWIEHHGDPEKTLFEHQDEAHS